MSSTLRDAGLILLFILTSGLFVAAELALVSLREGQLRTLAARGKRGQRVADLAAEPNRFLAAVQIGVTVTGFLSAAFGAATLGKRLAPRLESWGLSSGAASALAIICVTLVISYVSIVLGELVPKRLALQRSEGIALVVAPFVDRMARLLRPVIWLLSRSTNGVVRLVGGDPDIGREEMSEEELRTLVSEHESLGEEERRIVEDVLDVGERQLREVMLPRTEVDFLEASTPVRRAVEECKDRPHSRYPVMRGTPDEVVGFVHVRDLFDPGVAAPGMRVGELVRDVLQFPSSKRVLPALSEMRASGQHLAMVVDEYGGTAGIVTLEDLVEELVGDIRDEYDVAAGQTTHLTDGAVEVGGLLNLEDFEDELGFALPDGPYETVAGYVVAALGHLPRIGETVAVGGHTLTVTELDGRRISRLRVH
ncbi:MAG TPA: hemolysin family protein [Actinomycetes bacterium]|nr:hemolysin family protein [Actinomycetes bacterium]